eukprot:TRINITY_DN32720_c0_g1_i1.p1 TRINITY_DN32720_c0_g1~~TRINITY_DN32720_c0_g1_i1.p1  ORF type:complete len:188 (+),score=36.27 TRINITY_DN32720_c0_g1_i1:60-623(+)
MGNVNTQDAVQCPWSGEANKSLEMIVNDLSTEFPRCRAQNEIEAVFEDFLKRSLLLGIDVDKIRPLGGPVACKAKINRKLDTISLHATANGALLEQISLKDVKQIHVEPEGTKGNPINKLDQYMRFVYRGPTPKQNGGEVLVQFRDIEACAICFQLIPILVDCNNGLAFKVHPGNGTEGDDAEVLAV